MIGRAPALIFGNTRLKRLHSPKRNAGLTDRAGVRRDSSRGLSMRLPLAVDLIAVPSFTVRREAEADCTLTGRVVAIADCPFFSGALSALHTQKYLDSDSRR
jgi:hypothetical protein